MSINHWEDSELAPQARRHMTAWDLHTPALLAESTIGLVLRVERSDGTAAVMKCLSKVGRREEAMAASVLAAFDGQGAVKIIASTEDVLLMEYCTGPQLNAAKDGTDDAVALPVICDVVRRLLERRPPPPEGLPTLAHRCTALKRGASLATDARMRALLLDAVRLSAGLLATQTEACLLHGDLHHENIMRTLRAAGEAWVSIDPQGIVGERAYEVANIFGNPSDRPDIVMSPERPARLADYFSDELGIDRGRVLRWAFVHSCISAAWSIEDGGNPDSRFAVAERIARLL